jgi:hypothetical protein
MNNYPKHRKSRPKKQFCVRGHDTFKCGRTKNNNCIQCREDYIKQWNLDNKEKIAQQSKERYEKNKKEHNRKTKEYYKKNKKKILGQRLQWEKKKLKNDPCFKLTSRLRRRIRAAIKNNANRGSAIRNLGCSIEFFKDYIEKKFKKGMTWDNWGTYWELDHIKELWEFDLTDKEQFLQAVNYKNMQPLTIPEHEKKTAKNTAKRAKQRAKKKKK